MANAEKLLKIASESSQLGSYGDALSFIVDSVHKTSGVALSDEDLMQVAGGISADSILIKKLKTNLKIKE